MIQCFSGLPVTFTSALAGVHISILITIELLRNILNLFF